MGLILGSKGLGSSIQRLSKTQNDNRLFFQIIMVFPLLHSFSYLFSSLMCKFKYICSQSIEKITLFVTPLKTL